MLIRIRIGSELSGFVDPDPDWAKMVGLDPQPRFDLLYIFF
jgi:hypothetical protein